MRTNVARRLFLVLLHLILAIAFVITVANLRPTFAFAQQYLESPYNDADQQMLKSTFTEVKADSRTGLDFDLAIWSPAEPGHYPVYFFLTGLNGFAPPEAYDEMMTKLARRGVVIVIPKVIFMAPDDAIKFGMKFIETTYWMERFLPHALSLANPQTQGVVPESKKLIVSAHSSAVKTMIELYRNLHEKIAGLVLIDPVNQAPINDAGAIGKDEYFAYGTSILILGSGLGSVPGRHLGKFWPPCAPDEYSAHFFYQHFSGPKWFIKATDFGHADMLGTIYYQALKATRFCKVAEDKNPSQYRLFLAGAIAAFAHGAIGEHTEMLRFIEDSSLLPIKNLLEFDRVGH